MADRVIFLDSQPLGLLSHPTRDPQIRAWASRLLAEGDFFVIPAIVDYELRREMTRMGSLQGIVSLNSLHSVCQLLPISDVALRLAAEFWAMSRRHGKPTAAPDALDVDVILAAQAVEFARTDEREVIVATSNVRHLGLFVPAARWQDII